jgi:exonuclease SbcC
MTHLEIPCPGCGRTLRVRTVYLGKRIACKYCDYVFQPVAAYQRDEPSELGSEALAPSAALQSGRQPDHDGEEIARLREALAAAETRARELDTIRAEREELTRQRQEDARQIEDLRARIGELERIHVEAGEKSAALTRSHEEASALWKAERQELHRLWVEKYRAQAQELGERLHAEQERASAERQRHRQALNELLRQSGALRQETEQRLRGELEQLREELTSSQALSDRLGAAEARARELDTVRAERDRLAEQARAMQADLDLLQDETVRQKALEEVCARPEMSWVGTGCEQLAAEQADMQPREQRAALQREVARLRQENVRLLKQLESFGVYLD